MCTKFHLESHQAKTSMLVTFGTEPDTLDPEIFFMQKYPNVYAMLLTIYVFMYTAHNIRG